jgi:hypothetical protein
MRIVRSTAWTAALAAAFVVAGPLQAQTTKMPSTLRWGMGHVDVPSAAVLPHMAIVPTVSGFWVNLDNQPIISENGVVIGTGGPLEKFYSDASVSLGLFDRVDIGAALHSMNDNDVEVGGEGTGTMWGGWGQLALLRPGVRGEGIGLAVGMRYMKDPQYDPDVEQAVSRLGQPDNFLRQWYGSEERDVNTNWTEYAVLSAFLSGLESGFIPQHDFTFSVGWGNGLFKDGDFLPWYSYVDSEGWFAGATMHMALTDAALLNLSGDWNGFDVNLGAQLDLNGIRLGAHVMGANYMENTTIYRSRKFGVLGSVALCPGTGSMLCRANLIERETPDTIRLPAPPPDTITVTRDVTPPLPTGQAATICLATGEAIQVLVTAQGDTLVGATRTSIRTLRAGGVVFAGEYAAGRSWFEANEPITFEAASYQKSGNPVRLNCPDIMRVGEYMGVPIFVMRNATRPYTQIYLPVTPGIWQMYENLRGTRGDQ